MIKKILLVFTLLLTCTLVHAQSGMTDEQVVRFVLEQQEKGKTQTQIVQQLLQRGVTPDQMRRVRKKYEAEQEQLGASDLTGSKSGSDATRLRTKRQLDGEDNQRKNNYMVRSQLRGKSGTQNYTRQENEQMLNDEIAFLDIDSLNYYRNLYSDDDENQIFGHNIFNNEFLTFEPNMNMATPTNYRLGAGDNVIIDVWGASQESFTGVISPDGVVVIEGVGPIKLAGLSVGEATQRLRTTLGRYYSDSQISLSVGEMRTIQVQVMGEVRMPGTYTLSSLASAFNALYAAGGISDIGTLRDIKVYRSGREIASIDVYDYLLNGNAAGDIRLQDNDVVLVGAYDCLVEIRGKVKRPMFYEMRSGESLSTVIDYAGGFTGDAFRKNVRVVRKNGIEYSIHTVEEFDMSAFALADGDSLYVDSVIPRFSNMVEVRGAVFHPGMFQSDGTISTVRDLLNAAGGLREDALTSRAVMHRRKEDMTLEVLSVDVKGVMDGTIPDIPLRKDDVLFVASKLDMVGEQTLTISGEVNYPGVYVYAENSTIEDLVLQAGGLTNAASLAKVDVYRRINDPRSTEDISQLSETFSFSLKDGFVIEGEPAFTLQPFDEVVVRKSPTYYEQQNVTIEGSVNFAGQYSMTSKQYKLTDLVTAAGGLSSLAYAKGARLERTMTTEEKLQREASLRAQQIALYEESMQSDDKNFDIQRADSLLTLKLDLGNTYPVAIDLEAAMKNPEGVDNVQLRDGDKLIVPQYSSTVKISGDVMYPTSMNYRQGETLSYYIKRAGGYGDNARKRRVYAVYMNGSVELVNHHSKKAIQPGCEIVVPSKKNKRLMTASERMSIGTSAASIATMVITVANILK
ncbi:MAG: SLBB domain-containing protein [Prevotellaceae bacterium]|nr:SLBB domain-containing protein [Prevotellaceae bacterium]